MKTQARHFSPFTLGGLRRELETKVRHVIRRHERINHGPMEIDLFFPNDGAAELGDPHLRRRVRSIVTAFHRRPIVKEAGLRVTEITAIDADDDERAAVRILWDFPGYWQPDSSEE